MADGIQTEGFREFLSLCKDPEFMAQPARNYLERSVISIKNKARWRSPVDRGQLRQAIGTQIDSSPVPQWGEAGVIGANEGSSMWEKAVIMEYGAGSLADGGSPFAGGSYKPEVTDGLNLWAKRHGFLTKNGGGNGWLVANIIAKKGGIAPRHYLRDGVNSALTEINNKFLKQMGDEIVAAWRARGK